MVEARRRFARLVAQPEASVELGHAALLVAAEERPGLDVEHYRARLYELGLAARERIVSAGDANAVGALNKYLFEELGFAGNQSDYYDPRNSLLSDVLDRRTGIPITLSLVYMEVGRRAGLRVEGVGLPGHFIVRATAAEGEESSLVDPFNGKTIDADDCQERLDTIYGGQAPLTDAHLRPVATRDILARLLRNLKGVYAQAGLYRRALSIIERILLVAPHELEERRDRGALLAQLGRYAEAVVDVEAYLKGARNPPDAERVAEQLKQMQLQLARLN